MCGSCRDKAAVIFADNGRVIALFDQGNLYFLLGTETMAQLVPVGPQTLVPVVYTCRISLEPAAKGRMQSLSKC